MAAAPFASAFGAAAALATEGTVDVADTAEHIGTGMMSQEFAQQVALCSESSLVVQTLCDDEEQWTMAVAVKNALVGSVGDSYV